MYKSPISLIMNESLNYAATGVDPDILEACTGMDGIIKEIQEKQEQAIYSAIQCQMAVEVDKNELVRALAYDRGQYDEGYRDGYAAAKEEFAERIQKAREVLEGIDNGNMEY